jgi:hypothetical protein
MSEVRGGCSIEPASGNSYAAAMHIKKVRPALAQYNLRPDPITGVAVANLPGSEPVIALSQASADTPIYLVPDIAERLAAELEQLGMTDVARRISDEIAKVREG